MTDSPETTESIEFSEQDVADLAMLGALPEGTEVPSYHPILEVWRELLKPATELAAERVTPQYASRIVASYAGITFADMPEVQARYYGKIVELLEILDFEIGTDAECLTYATPEEDVEHNGHHYKNLLLNWQLAFLSWELTWDCTDPAAAIELVAISEVHKMFFGPTGLTQFLDNIRFNEIYTEDDQAILTAALEELREGEK